MKKIIIVFTLFSCVICRSQVNAGMPNILDVASIFFHYYTPPYDKVLIQFQKKLQGWFVAEYDYQTQSIHTPASLFWDKAKQQYNTLNYTQANDQDTSAQQYFKNYVAGFIGDVEQYGFGRMMFYGYPGWEKDVIDYAGKLQSPPDSVLESLAYAYINLALGYSFGVDEPGLPGDTDIVQLNSTKPFSTSRLKKYIEYSTKAIGAYRKLFQHNPDYQTPWGNAGVSVAGESVNAYCTLQMFGHEKEGLAFLNNLQFPDTITARAKRVLGATDENGILFETDENLTNAIRYLQYKGFRKDVAAINFYLLNDKMAVAYLDKVHNHGLFTMKSSFYLDDAFMFAQIKDSGNVVPQMRLDSFLSSIYNSPKQAQPSYSSSNNTSADNNYVFGASNVYIPVSKTDAQKLFTTAGLYDTINIHINSDYLQLGEIVLLNIFQKNFCHRHIYFDAVPQDFLLSHYLVKRGDVWELMPEMP